ncbi:hypothetical protein D1BOALGB6SA_10186 [Olavius sp. associated proteobacterium Delta 1]|nr:hypothetical protein D1BOALGB6SA_10186 [Olavius sp. associated proteobacterium Delta 1]
MSGQNSVDKMFDAIAGVLIRCFVIGIVLLTIWLVVVMGVPHWAWQMHGKFFDLSGEQVVLVQYTGLLMTKVVIFALFLFPYIGIKFAQRKRNRRPSSDALT